MMDDTELRLERLVDGELSHDDERQLLLALEDDPRQWRRLALLFLEDRALRTSLGRMVEVTEPLQFVSRPAIAPPMRSFRFRTLLIGSLTAVCAFCLGLFLRNDAGPAVNVGPESIARQDPPAARPPAERTDAMPPEPDRHDVDSESTEYIAMKLVGNDNVALQEVTVPVISPPQSTFTNSEVRYQPMVPPEVREALLRQGKTVSEQVQLIPIQLEDGREAVLPITDIRVRPLRSDEVF